MAMSRSKRPYAPGTVFHITTRTQGKVHWFTDRIKARILESCASAFAKSDALLLAYAVMCNHIHLVLQQGEEPLWRILQPLLGRVALAVKASNEIEGHVFARRFRDSQCLSPDYVRNAIAYTHLNGVDAGLAEDPAGYAWTSHGAYIGMRSSTPVLDIAIADGLRLFGRGQTDSLPQLREDYLAFMRLRWITRQTRAGVEIPGIADSFSRPAGDLYWSGRYAPLFNDRAQPRSQERPFGGLDLRDLAISTAKEIAPDLDMTIVRSRRGGPDYVQVRWRIIERLHVAGFSGIKIARFLNVSPTCVSQVVGNWRAQRVRDSENGQHQTSKGGPAVIIPPLPALIGDETTA
jgi:REP element-mobilizing transposase RayT